MYERFLSATLQHGDIATPQHGGLIHRLMQQMAQNQTYYDTAAERVYVLGGTGLAVYGMLKKSALAGLPFMLIGGALVARGLAERHRAKDAAQKGSVRAHSSPGLTIERELEIARPVEEVYAFWRSLENLPRFFDNLESVRELGDGKSSWVAKGPDGTKLTWDAELVADIPGEMIVWRSLQGATIENHGSVGFHGEGDMTRMHLVLHYSLPFGVVGARAAKLMGHDPEQTVDADLARFKSIMENGANRVSAI